MQFCRVTDLRSEDGYLVPAYLFEPERARGGVAVAHGYGGCKEQMLGLAAHLGEAGWASLVFDLRGHGEHPAPLDQGLLGDLEAALGYLRRYGKVVAVGHSLGGRLALGSSADCVISISPAVGRRPSEEGRQMLLAFGSTAVRSPHPGYILELLRGMEDVKALTCPVLLLHAEQDIPSLIEGAAGVAARLPHGTLASVTAFQHGEAPLSPAVLPYLHRWFNHVDLKFNPEVVRRIVGWLDSQGRAG